MACYNAIRLLNLVLSFCGCLISANQLATKQEVEPVPRVDMGQQSLLCSYTEFSTFEYEKVGFGGAEGEGYFRDHKNGTATCSFPDDGKNRLACMALMKTTNLTDESGNVTYINKISAQGCWVKPLEDLHVCLDKEKCVAERWKSTAEDKPLFCCCSDELCNRLDNIEVRESVEDGESSRVPAGLSSNEDNNTIIIVSVVIALFSFSVLGVAGYYYYCRRKAMAAQQMQMKVAQYKQEMRALSDKAPDINYDDLALGVCLHRGRFGDVYRAKLNDKEVCVKYFHAQQRSLFLTEKEIYSVLDPNVTTIVQCLASDERSHPDGTVQYIVIMEYIPHGSLNAYLKSHTLSWREFCSMAQTAAAGIGYLHGETLINGFHKHAVVHRDINSRNILVRRDMTCVIADMGFSMKIRGSKVVRNGVEEHAEDGSLRDVGTVRYMAPEILDCAVNLRDCESSLKQIDMYAFSLVLWELITRCRDILYETKRYMLPFEEELGSHPGFETMRLHVAKEHNRPSFPASLKRTDATQLLRETVEECWDTDAEARLSALCVEERFKDVDALMEQKAHTRISMDGTCYDKRKRLSSSSTELIGRDYQELSPLLETDTPASESNVTTITNLDTPRHDKPDVNLDMDRDRPARGRAALSERNALRCEGDGELGIHDGSLTPVHEAKVRQAAEEERVKRMMWEEQQLFQPAASEGGRGSRPPTKSVHIDVDNEDVNQSQKPKENNLNVKRHNSQRNVYESSTSSNGGAGNVLTIPDSSARPDRPKSLNLNLNIKPEMS